MQYYTSIVPVMEEMRKNKEQTLKLKPYSFNVLGHINIWLEKLEKKYSQWRNAYSSFSSPTLIFQQTILECLKMQTQHCTQRCI